MVSFTTTPVPNYSESILLPEPEIHHLPDLTTKNGALDLMSLCFLVIFGNVVDFRTYCVPNGGPVAKPDKNDVNDISIDERYNMCVARGICLELLRWWNSKYSISTPESTYENDFATHIIAIEASALLLYKGRAEKDGRPGAPGCTLDLLFSQVTNVFNHLKIDPITHGKVFGSTRGGTTESGVEITLGTSPEYLEKMTLTCRNPPTEYGIGLRLMTVTLN